MREIKLPDEFDIEACQKEKALKEAEHCVYCGSKRVKQNEPSIIKIKEGFLRKKSMCEIICKCKDCGAIYATEPYPLDKKSEKEMKVESRKLIRNILLACFLSISIVSSLFMIINEVLMPWLAVSIAIIIFIGVYTFYCNCTGADLFSAITTSVSIVSLIFIVGLADSTDCTDIYVYDDNGAVEKVYENVNICTIEFIDDNNVLFNDPNTGIDVYYLKEKIKIKDEE